MMGCRKVSILNGLIVIIATVASLSTYALTGKDEKMGGYTTGFML